MKTAKWSYILPAIMLIYLGFMAYVGYPHLLAGEYLFYFGIIGISLVIIIALHFVLKKKELLRQKAAEETYTTYAAEQQSAEQTVTGHNSSADSGDNDKKA